MSEVSSSAESGAALESSSRSRAVARYLGVVWGIVRKDLAAERRSRELLGGMLVFALLVILIFNYALRLDLRTRETVTAGVLWVTLIFSGTLGRFFKKNINKFTGRLRRLDSTEILIVGFTNVKKL